MGPENARWVFSSWTYQALFQYRVLPFPVRHSAFMQINGRPKAEDYKLCSEKEDGTI